MDSEVLHQRQDKGLSGLAREGMRRKRGGGPLAPALWSVRQTNDFEPIDPVQVWGSYPKGFVAWACRALQVAPSEVLHVCSGSLRAGQGIRVDIRAAARPDVIADGRCLPFPDASFPAVMIDPPYTVEYSVDFYGTEYPRPSHLLREASRVVRPCGRVGILHFLVPMSIHPLRMEAVYGITTGAGYRIRAFAVYQRDQDELWESRGAA